jgi:mevalonate kinase
MRPSAYQTKACAKLIVSGEHSVCYGGPAFGIPIPLFLNVSCHYTKGGPLSVGSEGQSLLTSLTLASFPEEILAGWHFQIHSDIPSHYGLGSSSALICALLNSCFQIVGRTLSFEEFWQKAKSIEHAQHGTSSGFDLAVVEKRSGLLYRPSSQTFVPLPASPFSLALVFSGKSFSSTQECVVHVNHQKRSSVFWDNWASLTEKLYEAWNTQDRGVFQEGLNKNNQLLEEIGVVPLKVSSFLKKWRSKGEAGKVCGSGSVLGDGAGVLLVTYGDSSRQELKELCKAYDYEWLFL